MSRGAPTYRRLDRLLAQLETEVHGATEQYAAALDRDSPAARREARERGAGRRGGLR